MIYKGQCRKKGNVRSPPTIVIRNTAALLPFPSKLEDDNLNKIPTIRYEKPPSVSQDLKQSSAQSKVRKHHRSERVNRVSQEVYKWNRSYSSAHVKKKIPNGSRIPSCYPIGEYVGSLSDNEGDMYDHVTSPSSTGRRRSMSISDLTNFSKDVPNYSLQVPSFLGKLHPKNKPNRSNSKPTSVPSAVEMDDDMTDLYDGTLRGNMRERSNTVPTKVRLSGMTFPLHDLNDLEPSAAKVSERESTRSSTSVRPVTQYVNSEIVEQHRESMTSDMASTIGSPLQERIVSFRNRQEEEPAYVTMKPAKGKRSLPNLESYLAHESPPPMKPLSVHDNPIDTGPPIELVNFEKQPHCTSVDINSVVSDSEA